MTEFFKVVLSKIEGLVHENSGNLCLQTCQILKQEIYHYDWVGFYVLKGAVLELDAFAGKPTEHISIAVGQGVCGQVAERKETIIVQDVRLEDNYIACSLEVQSEIVVPIMKDGEFVAELDIDSHSPAPFSKDDQVFLEKVCSLLAPFF